MQLDIANKGTPPPRGPPTPNGRPSLGAALKWGWVQFLAAFAAVWWLAARFEWAMFRLRVLGTRVVSDVAPRMHKFE